MPSFSKLVVAVIFATPVVLGLSACGASSSAHKPQHSVLYSDPGSNTAYTRTWDSDSNSFIFWYIVMTTAFPQNSSSASLSGTWTRTESIPPTASSTSRVVTVDEKGEPQEETEPASDVPADEVVNENTTQDEAQTSVDDSSGNNDGGSGDSGGGSGDSGGDSGGGDSGGGGDGG